MVSTALLVVYGVLNDMKLKVRVLEVPMKVNGRFAHFSDLHITTVHSWGFSQEGFSDFKWTRRCLHNRESY